MSELRVLVTGGGRGIGRAIALEFARHKSRVAIAGRTSAELDAVVEEIDRTGGKGCALQMDVREYGSVEAAVYRAVEFTGGALDVLVNNAGTFEVRPFPKLDPGTWKRHIEVNLDGPFFVTREALDALEKSERAHIFNIASIAARVPFEGNVAYCASKYGLRGFSDALRLDLAPKKIRVTTVYPGPTNTRMLDALGKGFDRSRAGSPDDVAKVVWETYHAPGSVDDVDVPAPKI
jgi:3-oxoacyl-[acyl-carrier protein] reductase